MSATGVSVQRAKSRILSCSTVSFDGYEPDLALRGIVEAGFEWVELGFIEGYVSGFSEGLFERDSIRTTRRELSVTGLRCSGVSAHMDLGLEDSLKKMERRIRFCAAVEAPRLITNAAAREHEREFSRTMEGVMSVAEREKITVCLENPGNGITNVVNDGATAAAVARRFSSPFLKINYDCANALSHFGEHFPAERDFAPACEWIEQLHLKDVRVGPDGHYEYPALGDGMIDFTEIARTIGDSGALAALCIEIPLRLRRRPDASPYRMSEPVPYARVIEVLVQSRGVVVDRFKTLLRN